MESNSSSEPSATSRARKLLFGWPIALATLTVALLFVAGRVSAWHRGDRHPSHDAWKAGAARVLDRLLGDLEASDAQAATIHRLAGEIMDRLARTRDEHADSGLAWQELMTAETLDAGALESLRSEQFARADAVSAELLAKATEILETLTPAQRRELFERLDELHGLDHPRLHPHPRHRAHD